MSIDDAQAGPTRPILKVSRSRPVPDVVVLAVAGEVDLSSAPELVGAVTGLEAAPRHLVIDVAAVTFFGSSGVRALLAVRRFAEDAGTVLHLAGALHNRTGTVLAVTGVADRFTRYFTAGAALRRIASSP